MSAPSLQTLLFNISGAVGMGVLFGWITGALVAVAFVLGWFCGSYDEYFDSKARRHG